MSFRSASKDLGRSYTFTNLELNGGYDCNKDFPWKAVDLLVQGGAYINKSMCIGGNICVGDLLMGDVCGNLFTQKIMEKEPMQGIDLCGNVSLLGDIVPSADNMFQLGTIDNKWANIIAQDVTVCGTLFANGMMNMVDGNMLTANTVCINEYLETDEIRAKTTNGNIRITDNIDMTCSNISNTQALFVDQIFGKNSPINFEDDANFRDNHQITFEQGINIGDTSSVSGSSTSIAIGKNSNVSSTNSIGLGNDIVNNDSYAIAIGQGVTSNGVDSIAIGRSSPSNSLAQATAWGQIFSNRAWLGGGFTGAAIDNNGNIIRGNVGGGSGNIIGNLDMMCNDISNVMNLYVDTIHGKASPWNSADDMNMLNGNAITFVQGIRIGDTNTSVLSNSIGLGKSAQASGSYSTVLGYNSQASGTNSISVGRQVNSTNTNSIGIGLSVNASGQQSISIGSSAQAIHDNSIAIGTNANCPTGGANNLGIAIGFNSTATGQEGVAIGRNSSVGTLNNGVSIGSYNNCNGLNGVSIGRYSTIIGGTDSISIGHAANTSANFCIAIGSYVSTGNGGYNIGIGNEAFGSLTSGIRNIAIGELAGSNVTAGLFQTSIGHRSSNSPEGRGELAIGHQTETTASFTTAIGYYASSSSTRAVALGAWTQASGESSICIGTTTSALGTTRAQGVQSIGLGYSVYADGNNSVAIGTDVAVVENDGIAVGRLSRIESINSIAIGVSAEVNTGSGRNISIGNNANTSNGNSIAIGTSSRGQTDFGIAIGYNARVLSDFSNFSIAIGKDTTVDNPGSNAIVIGHMATASEDDVIVLGTPSPSNATANATAWGQTFSSRSWIGGGLTGAAIDDNGNIVRGNVSGDNGNIMGNLDMMCNDISNVMNLYVDTVHGKASPWNSADDMNMLNGNAITFAEGIRIGNSTTTASTASTISIGKNASGNNYGIAIGNYATADNTDTITIGRSASDSSSGAGDCILIGRAARSAHGNAIVIGSNADSTSLDCIVLGTSTPTSVTANAEAWGQTFSSRTWDDGTTNNVAGIDENGNLYKTTFDINNLGGNVSVFSVSNVGVQIVSSGSAGANVQLSVLDSNNMNPGGSWSTDSFTVISDGWYHINGGVDFEPLDNKASLELLVNNTNEKCFGQSQLFSTGANAIISVDCTVFLETNDIVSLAAKQYTGSDRNLHGGRLSIHRI